MPYSTGSMLLSVTCVMLPANFEDRFYKTAKDKVENIINGSFPGVQDFAQICLWSKSAYVSYMQALTSGEQVSDLAGRPQWHRQRYMTRRLLVEEPDGMRGLRLYRHSNYDRS